MSRYLEIDVAKVVNSTLFVEIDDNDERFKDVAINDPEPIRAFTKQKLLLSKLTEYLPLREAVSETIADDEWDSYPLCIEITAVKEVSKEEAKQFEIFTLVNHGTDQ